MILKILTFTCSFGFFGFLLPQAEASILNVNPGIYEADGKLLSQGIAPNLKFHSQRRLENGRINATTKASLWGMEIATVSAHLEVQWKTGSDFDLLDVDNQSRKAGEGNCNSQGCTFTATVMNGDLTLSETWIPTANGFDAVNCAQSFKGNDATYVASFHKTGDL